MAKGDHGLSKVSPVPAMPYPFRPASGPPHKRAYGCFRDGPLAEQAACGRLLPFWTPPAIHLYPGYPIKYGPESQYPERPIIFLSGCYFMVAVTYMVGFFIENDIACREGFKNSEIKAFDNYQEKLPIILQGTKVDSKIKWMITVQ
jgi:hypothetical protein